MLNQHRILRVLRLIQFLRRAPSKTLPHLAHYLNASERTVYRYLDLLKDLGFEVLKDREGRVSIANSSKDLLPFTEQEQMYLIQLVRSVGQGHLLARGILAKLLGDEPVQDTAPQVAAVRGPSQGQPTGSPARPDQGHPTGSPARPDQGQPTGSPARPDSLETAGLATALHHAHVSHLIETISRAIEEGRQIRLVSYASAHSQTIEDRVVEPVCFTEQYRSLSAFEPASTSNKYFNIERMGDVEILDHNIQFKDQHRYFKPDVFGFQSQEPDKVVEMELSLRGMLLLREQYPASAARITPIESKAERGPVYRFNAKVQDFRAPAAFALRLPHDVRVLGSKNFLAYLEDLRLEVT